MKYKEHGNFYQINHFNIKNYIKVTGTKQNLIDKSPVWAVVTMDTIRNDSFQ